jgi:hypothetical protein
MVPNGYNILEGGIGGADLRERNILRKLKKLLDKKRKV